jgi:Bacterial mobilisation protein (MobC)
MWPVVATEFFKVRVQADVKRHVTVAAQSNFMTESAWIRALVMRELAALEGAGAEHTASSVAVKSAIVGKQPKGRAHGKRVHVRLRAEDRLLLDARAEARGMRPATYVSVLIRSHLRNLVPLPKDELLALRCSIGELAAIGRNINQIARAVNTDGWLPRTVQTEFRAMLTICEALRDNTKALLKANLVSWNSGCE